MNDRLELFHASVILQVNCNFHAAIDKVAIWQPKGSSAALIAVN
jgi:hypothetical protein